MPYTLPFPTALRLLLATAAVLIGFAASAGAQQPAAGQTLAEFQDAVYAHLATQGDRMGYALVPCRLTPPFTVSGETYLGRTFNDHGMETAIVLVAVENGRVARWEDFALPGYEGWITHHGWSCNGRSFTTRSGNVLQRYRWDGRTFKRAAAPR